MPGTSRQLCRPTARTMSTIRTVLTTTAATATTTTDMVVMVMVNGRGEAKDTTAVDRCQRRYNRERGRLHRTTIVAMPRNRVALGTLTEDSKAVVEAKVGTSGKSRVAVAVAGVDDRDHMDLGRTGNSLHDHRHDSVMQEPVTRLMGARGWPNERKDSAQVRKNRKLKQRSERKMPPKNCGSAARVSFKLSRCVESTVSDLLVWLFGSSHLSLCLVLDESLRLNFFT